MIGQAYSDIFTSDTQEALAGGCDLLIDGCFDALQMIEEPKDIVHTTLVTYLPKRYLYRYTPLFLKQFVVCIITVTWKLAQPTHVPLSSLAEELAAWAIIHQTKVFAEIGEETKRSRIEEELDKFVDIYFEDLDFRYLFDDAYDGIDETQLAKMLGISSLGLDMWFVPFSDDPFRIAHPYTYPS